MKRKNLIKIVVFTLGVISIASIMPKGIEAKADITNGWNNYSGNWYYYENGEVKSGWFVDNGKWYVADENGVMKMGWYNAGGEWYFLGSDGSMKTGWIRDGSKWYYMENNGPMKKGWIKTGSNWYYLNNDGSMKTGWLEYNGKWYYLLDTGSMAVNTTVNGYRFDANGWWLRDIKADQEATEIINSKNIIKKADSNYINNITGGYNLIYDKASDEASKKFGITEETYAFAFQNEDQVDKYYFRGKTSGKVYKTSSNGLFAAYLIKDGKIVERFKGPEYNEKSEKDFLKYLGNGEFK
jgi:hypothetical protein